MVFDDKFAVFFAIICGLMFVWALWSVPLNMIRKRAVAETPVTEEGLAKYDDLPAGLAVAHAWSDTGNNPHYHRMMQDDVRAQMPLLARALDRMVDE